MRKLLYALLVLALLAGIWLYAAHHRTIPAQTETAYATYSNPELGIAFDYLTESYIVQEVAPTQSGQVGALALMRTTDAAQGHTENSEPPPRISIIVLSNDLKQFPVSWAQQHPSLSAYNLKTGADTEAVVGGANAVSYEADGLYLYRYYVVAHGQNIYVISGPSTDEDLSTELDSLVRNIRFIPSPGQ